MADHEIEGGSTTEGLPVAPSMAPALTAVRVPRQPSGVDRRVVFMSGVAVAIAMAAAGVAQALTRLIGLVTNLAFYGRVSTAFVSPAGNHLGWLVVVVPVAGGLGVGWIARWGSVAIRGHGIPEAMEQVLFNQSRIPPRVTFLKPISAALAIGTGGPFGAEGPIIATGGALGSLVGQLLHITADERKTLLAAGAAAGMAATFGSPVSAVLLAIELLLFEYRPRSLVPVALAAAAATGVRVAMVGSSPAFAMPELVQPGGAALALYIGMGLVVGIASVGVTRAVYAVEDGFARLPMHWMWWPALGGVVVGLVGVFHPLTLGVGYDNIERFLGGGIVGRAALVLCAAKFVSWVIALGSGTSGGTLAPLFTIGGGLGSALGATTVALLPAAGVDVRMAALVGMAAMFAGASRAVLTSVVFAFETTRQPLGLLPLLGGCSAAYLVSCLLMRHSIMTEKIARRGARVPSEYTADFLEQILVRDACSSQVVVLASGDALASVRAWLASGVAGTLHQGFPVADSAGELVGVVTRRDLLDGSRPDSRLVREIIKRPPAIVFEDSSLREAVDHMVSEGVGRLPVIARNGPRQVVGIITRSDILAVHAQRIDAAHRTEQSIRGVAAASRASPRPRKSSP